MPLMKIVEQSIAFVSEEKLEAGDNVQTFLGTLKNKNTRLHTNISELVVTNNISTETSISSLISALEELSLQSCE